MYHQQVKLEVYEIVFLNPTYATTYKVMYRKIHAFSGQEVATDHKTIIGDL